MTGYRIKTVASVTGVSPELLRAWERRYTVVSPRRTTGGYREYSERDVEKLRLLKSLTARGYTIGELARLSVPDLGDLLQRQSERKDTVAAPGPRHSVIVDHLVAQACEREPMGFRRALRRTLALLPPIESVDTVLLPMVAELAERSRRSGRFRAAHWFAVEEIRGFVGPLSREIGGDAPIVPICPIAVTPPGQRLLEAQLVCLREGVQSVSIPPSGAPWELARELGGGAAILCTEAEVQAVIELLDSWTSLETLVVFGEADVERAVLRRGARYVGVTGDLPRALRSVLDGRG